MKTKSIRIRYSSMKLDAILLAAKSDKSIEELVVESVDDLFKRTVSKDVQAFLNQMEQEKLEEEQKRKNEKTETKTPEEQKPNYPPPQSHQKTS